MKTLSIVGARPQFVKAAVVSEALQGAEVADVLVHTGQHYDDDMSAVFFRELGIPAPKYSLGVGSGRHGQQTGRMLELIEQTIIDEDPHWVIVYGDTNSTLAGALAAAKLHVPIAHVEAGLRSFNRRMPEEINRIVTDHTAKILFAPTETARINLRNEGIADGAVHVVGDVMYDAALKALKNIADRSAPYGDNYVLVTLHRAENVSSAQNLANISSALLEIAKRFRVVLPLHPGTRKALENFGLLRSLEAGIHIIKPLGYHDMLLAQRDAKLVVTDSGGVQKEAFFCGVPCVTLRAETEWVELVEAGWNRLASPTSRDAIVETCSSAVAAGRPRPVDDLYGGGEAATRIANILSAAVATF